MTVTVVSAPYLDHFCYLSPDVTDLTLSRTWSFLLQLLRSKWLTMLQAVLAGRLLEHSVSIL